ncbi:response regulator [Niabella drilacis]|uniref:Response regulator receiver domain-containing protein n=1 Tax=Niabella drilacis (strain DSM 25811 / CCM 8410 / CCUG 62505 / LMG 26954 / E90) TaxID=1285928 RepID=A0A1G6L369_NIADE|nr:response regulator [Niabella drilacis]SDC37759.1 Response regulator receiver domain-containing protein [Niabella drilacis]
MEQSLQYSNVLYVDDEIHNLNSFKACFRRDFSVFTAPGVAEALQVLKEQEIHLIITDQRMPETTGIEFLESIIKDYPDTIRMLLTGYADINAVVDAINKGRVFKYIQKPWEEALLRQTIKEGLALYATNRSKKQIAEKLEENNRQMEFLLRQSLLS